MNRWTTIVGALMLLLMLWTGGLAHAAEQATCIPATAESAAHFDGDGDEAPSDSGQETLHHHTGCSGHQIAASAEDSSLNLPSFSIGLPFPRLQAGLHGHDPDGQLRPPIA